MYTGYKVITDVRLCAARLAIAPPVIGGGSLLLPAATSPEMGISSAPNRQGVSTIIILLAMYTGGRTGECLHKRGVGPAKKALVFSTVCFS
jgi:hypothetical protein